MRTLRTVLLAAVLAATSMVAFASTASAEPPEFPITLECTSGTYSVVVIGNGMFAPGHDTASKSIFHPVAFPGDFQGTVLDAEGNVVDTFTEPDGTVRGNGGKERAIDECTFSFEVVGDGSDPFLTEGYTFIGQGNVNGYWSPPAR